MPAVKKLFRQNLKNAYWARVFKNAEGGYAADVPDMPGCATNGLSLEEVYQLLVSEAIPLWLEDQTWPSARTADEILALACDSRKHLSVLVRITADEVGGLLPLNNISIRPVEMEYDRRRHH